MADRRNLEGSAGFEKGHQLAFVVAGPAGHDLFAVRSGFEPRLEGRVAPKVQGIDRLHVVVAVEENMRRVAAAPPLPVPTTIDRPSVGWLDDVETEVAELADQPVGRPFAIGEMGRRGGYRGDRQHSRLISPSVGYYLKASIPTREKSEGRNEALPASSRRVSQRLR